MRRFEGYVAETVQTHGLLGRSQPPAPIQRRQFQLCGGQSRVCASQTSRSAALILPLEQAASSFGSSARLVSSIFQGLGWSRRLGVFTPPGSPFHRARLDCAGWNFGSNFFHLFNQRIPFRPTCPAFFANHRKKTIKGNVEGRYSPVISDHEKLSPGVR